jgi:hypothetical protein
MNLNGLMILVMVGAGPTDDDPPTSITLAEPGAVLLGPDASRPPRAPAAGIELVVHLHGVAEAVARARDEAGWNVPIVVFNARGLSSAYAQPFADDVARFGRLIDQARDALARAQPTWPRLASTGPNVLVSSFSAGFGGVRALLAQPDSEARIGALVLADSLYCGYDRDDRSRGVDAAKMAGFRAFAREAASGRKIMLVSHSAQVPEGYASTTETADDLIGFVGGKPAEAEALDVDEGQGWRLKRRYGQQGRFTVLGFAGEGAEDHMRHLRQMGVLWRMTGP